MKIATFNINGINSRLDALLVWLTAAAPDVVCLQELKSADRDFPAEALRGAGYSAIWQGQRSWNGVAILAKGSDPIEIRRGLPGNDADDHSRYLEAAVNGMIIGCLYLPNGNPQPGPKFDYKLAWFEHLIKHAHSLLPRVIRSCSPVTSMWSLQILTSTMSDPGRRTPCCSPPAAKLINVCYRRAGSTRYDSISRGADLYLLGLLPQPLADQLRLAY